VQERRFPSHWKDVLALLVMKPGEDPRELNRRRDIWLEPHGQKILQRMLTTGEYDEVAARHVPGSQAGFTELRGAAEQSWILRAHKEQCAEEHAPCYRAYLDYSTLFMSIVRDAMAEVEKRLGVRPGVTDVMIEMHRELKGRFETAWGMTDPVPIEEGSMQGAITSPVQAKRMLSVVQRVVTRTCEGFRFRGAAWSTPQCWYADDAAYASNDLAGLQLIFDTVWYASRVLGLTIRSPPPAAPRRSSFQQQPGEARTQRKASLTALLKRNSGAADGAGSFGDAVRKQSQTAKHERVMRANSRLLRRSWSFGLDRQLIRDVRAKKKKETRDPAAPSAGPCFYERHSFASAVAHARRQSVRP
jgi:hypothetical protein